MARGKQGEPDLGWLRRGGLVDEGRRTAVYPYFGLKEILSPEDCRPAVLDETQALEDEFGRALVEPLYRLLWVLNTSQRVCTSHTLVAPPSYPPPFDWAAHSIGSLIITLARFQRERQNLAVANDMVEELGRTLATSPTLEWQSTRGWLVRISPVNVSITASAFAATASSAQRTVSRECRAYGCQIIISGSASSRVRAGERWGRCVAFVADTLHQLQTTKGGVPAPPHRHDSS